MKNTLTLCLSVLFFIVMILVSNGFSQEYTQITDIGIDADSVGIGNILGFSNSSTAIFGNVAGLYRTNNIGISYFTVSLFGGELKYDSFSASYKLGQDTFGIGIMQAGIDGFSNTSLDSFNEIIEGDNFSYKSYLAKIAYQKMLDDNVSLGIALNYYRTDSLGIHGQGFNIDIGTIFLPSGEDGLVLSLLAQNVIPQMNVNFENSGDEDLPLQGYFGFMYPWSKNINIYGQLRYRENHVNFLKSGGIKYYFLDNKTAFASAGYREYFSLDSVYSTFVFGIGISLGTFDLNVAMEPYDYESQDSKTYFGLNANF